MSINLYISDDNIVIQEKDLAQRKLLDAWTFITPINDMSYQKYKNQYIMQVISKVIFFI